MRSKHFIFSLCVVVALTIFMAGQAFAGGGGMDPLPEGAVIVGPTVWATVVMSCVDGTIDGVATKVIGMISLRAKKIEDCDVQTEAQMADLSTALLQWACPTSAGEIVNNYIPDLEIFDKPRPVITKAKNFVNGLVDDPVDGTISFDAQIMYLQ